MKMNKMVVFDLETSSTKVEDTQILEIAAMGIDCLSWKPIPGSDFHSLVRPSDPDKVEATALAKNGLKMTDLAAAPSAKSVIVKFSNYLRQMGGATSSTFNAPFPGGKNIRDFDLPILCRYMTQFKLPAPFNTKRVFDLEEPLLWILGQANQVENISMDTVRPYFGMSSIGGHRAMFDVRQTAWLLCKINRLFRYLATSMAAKFQESGTDVDFENPDSWFPNG